MPRTENQKVVTAYLPVELYDKLEQFKLEQGLKSDSKVINAVLERWFFGEIPTSATAKTNYLEERLSQVEKTCAMLIEQVTGLVAFNTANVLSNVPDIVPSTGDSIVPDTVVSNVPDIVLSTGDSIVPDTVLSDVPDIVLSTGDSIVPDTVLSDVPDIVPSTEDSIVPDTVLSDVPDIVPSTEDSIVPDTVLSDVPSESKLVKGLGQRALAKRLGCSYQELGNVTIVRNGNIESWSKNQDPQGIGWELRDKKYYPCVFNVPSNVLNSESLESASDLLSEFVDKTTEQPGPIVICKFDKTTAKDPQHWRYWAGAKTGFIQNLREARLYTEKGANRLISQLLTDENHKPTVKERISSRDFEELLALGLI